MKRPVMAKTIQGSFGSPSIVSSAVALNDLDWEPDVRPVRSSLPHIGFSARNQDWNSVQQAVLSTFRRENISPSDLVTLVAKVKDLSKSEIGPFIYDYYKNQLLKKGMRQMREAISKNIKDGQAELQSIGDAWDYLYEEIVPVLQYVLHSIMTKDLSVKQATLVGFRDNVLLKFEIDEWLKQNEDIIPASIQQMLLVLQSVRECDPPSPEYMELEKLVARVVNPFLGYRGLYLGDTEPAIHAKKTNILRKRSVPQSHQPRPSSLVVPGITLQLSDPPSGHSLRHSRQASQTSIPAMAYLKPVVEHEGAPQKNIISYGGYFSCMLYTEGLSREVKVHHKEKLTFGGLETYPFQLPTREWANNTKYPGTTDNANEKESIESRNSDDR